MGYLVCDKCAGYYELQESEYPEDFKGCQCGGQLNYVENIEEDFTVGKDTNDVKSIGESNKIASKLKLSSNALIRSSCVLIGALVMLIPYFIYSPYPSSDLFVFNSSYSLLLWGAGGFIAALAAGGNIKAGVSNGFYAAVVSGLIVIIFFYLISTNYFNSSTLPDNLAFAAALTMVYLLVPAILSSVGGLIGILIRKSFEYVLRNI